jgi:Ca2+-transporting ATPase
LNFLSLSNRLQKKGISRLGLWKAPAGRGASKIRLGLFTNKYLIVAIAASITLQILATILPFFQVALGTVALSAVDWATIFVVSSTVLFADELRKLVQSRW